MTVTRSKEMVVHRYFRDGVFGEEREYKMLVYKREDGTEYINQKAKIPITRVNGKPTIERYSKTVQSFDMVGLLNKMKASGTPILIVSNPFPSKKP